MANLPEDTSALIERYFNEPIENFDIVLHSGNKKGQGYLGEVTFVSFEHKSSGKQDHLVVKSAFPSDRETTRDFISACYANEINVYTKILPAFERFQRGFPEATPLDVTAKCYATCSERGEEKIIVENFKFRNYETHPQRAPMCDGLYEKIFSLYGQYHALSFAFKHYQPENYVNLSKSLGNTWLRFKETELFIEGVVGSFKIIEGVLKANNEENILAKMQPYIKNSLKMFEDGIQYTGANSIILHGDARGNNLLLKYDSFKQVEDVKLIDFQMSMVGTPVYDLMYVFYSAAAKETMENWEKFLKIYHENLTKFLKEYNLDAKDVYPYEELKNEWRQYSTFGFIMGILVWGAQFISEDEINDLDLTEKMPRETLHKNVDYLAAVSNLIQHFYENNFL